ncbi:MAG: DUF11 domain-containing protein, partial [Anaerolineales bacterium]|nr:DUF11 domain-containing protein [Anaerolineales bacterium]
MIQKKRLLILIAVLALSLGLATAALAAAQKAGGVLPKSESLAPQEEAAPVQARAVQQAVNPGFTVDLTMFNISGLAGPGDVVTITRTTGGDAYGAAQADGVGFFWTPLYDSSGNGQPVSLLGNDTLEVYVNGALAETITPMTITGGIDVLADEVKGTIEGADPGVPVTVTVSGAWFQPPAPGAPLQTTTTDSNGDFAVVFSDIDLGANNLVAVDYFADGNYVRAYLYPNPPVFLVQQYNLIGGYAPREQNIHATVYITYPTDIRWEGDDWADWPHGWYQFDGVDVAPGDVVELYFDDSTVISQTIPNLANLSFDTDTEEVSGEAPDGEIVLASMWQWEARGHLIYSETQDTASGGAFAAAFSGDLRPRDEVLVSIADDEGHQTQLRSGPPFIDAYMDPTSNGDCIIMRVDGPNLPITYTLDTGSEIYTRTNPIGPSDAGNSLPFCYLMWGPGWGPIDFSPGNTITLRTPSWEGELVLADVSWQADTTGDAITGDAPAGEIEATVRQWYADYYPVNGAATRIATAASPYSADFSGFDVRDGGTVDLRYFDPISGFSTRTALTYENMRYFEMHLPWGVGGWTPVDNETITAYLYDTDGTTLLAQTSDDHDGSPFSFWYDDFQSEPLSPGRWITLTNGSDWEAGLQIPEITINADADIDLIWGEAPKTLIKISGGPDNNFDWFVPVDGYALDTSVFGYDLQESDTVRVTYPSLNGDLVNYYYFWPQARMDVNYAHESIDLQTLPNEAITITIAGKAEITGTSGMDGWFRTYEWGWDSWNLDIAPGDVITAQVSSLTGTVTPVGQIDIEANYDTDIVTGTIHAAWFTDTLYVGCEIWEGGGPAIYTDTVHPGGGQIVCDFDGEWDLEPWHNIAVRYYEPDGDSVINVYQAPYLEANYAHDWVQVHAEAGVPVTLTLTRGIDTYAVSGTADADDWFRPWEWSWAPEDPGINPGDVITAELMGELIDVNPVGQIDVEANYATNVVTGTIHAAWFTPISLTVGCEIWEEGGPGIYTDAVHPDGGQIVCDFDDPGWDLDPWHNIAVRYREPDGDWVINIWRQPTMDVNYAHDWIEVDTEPGVPVTITLERPGETYTVTGTAGGDGWFRSHEHSWAPEAPNINPGDLVTAETMGSMLTVEVGVIDFDWDYDADLVFGNIYTPWGVPLGLSCEIWEENGAGVWVDAVDPDGGYFECDFTAIPFDLQPGQTIAVRYREPDGDTVINVYDPPWMRVNYRDDWVGGTYPTGHTFWITVEDSLGNVKGTAEVESDPWSGWGGAGLETSDEHWAGGSRPDIQPGDVVYFESDDGYTNVIEVGEILGTLDLDNESIEGPISAGWFTEDLAVECHPWGAPGGVDAKYSTAGPDGDPQYFCQWDHDTEWDIQPGQDVAVMYVEPDEDRVINVFREPAPDLRVEKWTWGSGTVMPGGSVIFTIYYRNDGDATADTFTITDTLPVSLTYVSDNSGVGATPGSGWVAWTFGPLEPGEEGSFEVVLNNTADPGEWLCNHADVFVMFDGNWGNNHTEACVYVSDEAPNLYVNKNPVPGDPTPGQTMLWEINYGNNHSVASGAVTLTETLPLSTSVVDWYSENGYNLWDDAGSTPDQLILTAPSIPGNWGSRILVWLEIDPAVGYGTQLTNTVEITTAAELSTTIGDNYQMRNDVWTTSPRWDLAVWKELDWGVLVPDGVLEYHLSFRNHGNMPFDLVLTDTLPAGTTFVESRLWDPESQTQVPFLPTDIVDGVAYWDWGIIQPGEWHDLYVHLSIDPDTLPGTELVNCAEGSIDGEDGWPYDNAACVSVFVREPGPNLIITKSYSWNWEGSLTYDVRVMNVGTTVLENILVTDTLPVSTTFNGSWWHNWGSGDVDFYDLGGQLVWDVHRIEQGWNWYLFFGVDLDGSIHDVQGLTFVNTIEAPVPDDVYPEDNYDEVTAYTGPDVYVEKWLSGGEPLPGEILTFTVEFGNQNVWPWSTSPLSGSHITEILPDGMIFITATAHWDPNATWHPSYNDGTTITWDWGSMGPGSIWSFDVVVQIEDTVQGGDVLVNHIEAYGDSPTDVEVNWDNNEFDLPLTVLAPVFEVSKTYETTGIAGMGV